MLSKLDCQIINLYLELLFTEILYIVVCTYKSVIGLGHNSTKPVAILYE